MSRILTNTSEKEEITALKEGKIEIKMKLTKRRIATEVQVTEIIYPHFQSQHFIPKDVC